MAPAGRGEELIVAASTLENGSEMASPAPNGRAEPIYFEVPDAVVGEQPLGTIETRYSTPQLPLHHRVPLAGDGLDGHYSGVIDLLQQRFPVRAARLRDYLHRVQCARARYLERQQYEERLRLQRNHFANFVNGRVAAVQEALRVAHEDVRPRLVEELEVLEEREGEQAQRYCEVLAAAEENRQPHPAGAAGPTAPQAPHHAEAERFRRARQLQEEVDAAKQREEEDDRDGREETLRRGREAAAALGLVPSELHGNPRTALDALVDADAVLAEKEGVLPREPGIRWLRGVFELLATLACGTIFGLSVALLTGILRNLGSLEGQLPKVVAAAALGTAIFYLIGQLTERAFTLAAEHSEEKGKTAWGSLVLAVLVLVLLSVIEVPVERYGIVEAARKLTPEYRMGGGGSAGPLAGVAGWGIACVVAVPYLLYHAFAGWMSVRYRAAEQFVRQQVAREREGRRRSPEFRNLLAARYLLAEEERTRAAAPAGEAVPAQPPAEPRQTDTAWRVHWLQHDPLLARLQARVRRARQDLERLDHEYDGERQRLQRTRRAYHATPDHHQRDRMDDAREEWRAAQLTFDAELARVLRLLECPKYLRWWELLRQYLRRDGYSLLTAPEQKREARLNTAALAQQLSPQSHTAPAATAAAPSPAPAHPGAPGTPPPPPVGRRTLWARMTGQNGAPSSTSHGNGTH